LLYAGLAVGVLALVFGLGGRRMFHGVAGTAPPVRSLAVLPLETLSNDSTHLADEMTEALTTDLGRISALRVTSRAAAMRYGGSTLPASAIARELGVDAVLEGGVQRSGDRLRVEMQLISAATGSQLWAERFEEGMARRFAVEDAISHSLVSALKLSVTSSEEQKLRTPPTTNAAAYDDFLRGKIHLRHEANADNSVAIALFEQAVGLDPSFAEAYAWLAYAYGIRIFYHTPRDKKALETALVAAEKALRLDPELAEAHFARGFLLWSPANHFPHELAIQEYRHALELSPNLTDARDWLAVVYWHIGLFDKALAEFRQVLAIDPGNRLAQDRMGMVLVYQGQYEEAVRILRQIPRDFNPSLETYHFVWALVLSGRSAEAAPVIEDYLRRTPQDPGGVVTGVRAILHAKAGDARAAEADIKKAAKGVGFGHFHHTAYSIASAYALLRKQGLAVEWLRRAADDGLPCYPLLANDPTLDNLRQDPGFLALLAELKPQWERWRREL
jgi:TolB-like protein/lipoprotein NlpI